MPAKTLRCNHSGTDFEYQICDGFDVALAFRTDHEWAVEKQQIAAEMLEKYPDAQTDVAAFCSAIQEFSLEDWGWSWTRKAVHCHPPSYRWFYMISDGAVQGVAIIYHPEPSSLEPGDIFYVDYLATAFWNRNRPGYKKRFSGVGSLLIAHSINYAMSVLKLRPGFSLHSLPGAETYYRSIGMVDLGIDAAKENLRRFEAPQPVAKMMSEVSHG